MYSKMWLSFSAWLHSPIDIIQVSFTIHGCYDHIKFQTGILGLNYFNESLK